jgi:hypothetical protein
MDTGRSQKAIKFSHMRMMKAAVIHEPGGPEVLLFPSRVKKRAKSLSTPPFEVLVSAEGIEPSTY